MTDNFTEFPDQVETKISWEEWSHNKQKQNKEIEFRRQFSTTVEDKIDADSYWDSISISPDSEVAPEIAGDYYTGEEGPDYGASTLTDYRKQQEEVEYSPERQQTQKLLDEAQRAKTTQDDPVTMLLGPRTAPPPIVDERVRPESQTATELLRERYPSVAEKYTGDLGTDYLQFEGPLVELNDFGINLSHLARKNQGSPFSNTYFMAEEFYHNLIKFAKNGVKAGLMQPAYATGEFVYDGVKAINFYLPVLVDYVGAAHLNEGEKYSAWTDAFDALTQTTRPGWYGLTEAVNEERKRQKLTELAFPSQMLDEALDASHVKELINTYKQAMNIPEEEMTDILKTINFMGMYATFGYARGATTIANNVIRNFKKQGIIKKVVKATGSDYKPKTGQLLDMKLYRPISAEEARVFRPDNIRNTNMSESQLDELREKYFRLTGDKATAEKYARNVAFDFHMAVAGGAGITVGSLFENWANTGGFVDGFTELFKSHEKGKEEGTLPVIIGLAASFFPQTISQKMIVKQIAKGYSAAGKKLSSVGTFVSAVTPTKKIIEVLKSKGLSPSQAVENSFRRATLLSKGFQMAEIKNMENRILVEARHEIERIEEKASKSINPNKIRSDEYSKLVSEGKFTSIPIIGKESDSINKWFYLEKFEGMSGESVAFVQNFNKHINSLSDKIEPGQLQSNRQLIKDSIEDAYATMDNLTDKLPAGFGNIDYLLNHILQLTVIQSLKDTLTQKVTASAKSGKFVSNMNIIADIQKYTRQEANLINQLASVIRKNTDSSESNKQKAFTSALNNLKNHFVKIQNDSDTAYNTIVAVINKKSLDSLSKEDEQRVRQIMESVTDGPTGISRAEQSQNKAIEDARRLQGRFNVDKITLDTLGESISRLLFKGKDSIYDLNKTKADEQYKELYNIAEKDGTLISMDDVIGSLTSKITQVGVSKEFSDIFGTAVLRSNIVENIRKGTAYKALEATGKLNLKDQLEYINSRVYKAINSEHSDEIAKMIDDLDEKQLIQLKENMFDIIAKDSRSPTAMNLTDFMAFRKYLGEMSAKEFRSSNSTNERYSNIQDIIKTMDNTLESQQKKLSKGFKDANKNWRQTVLPFYDRRGSIWGKLFSSKDIDKGNIPTYNLLVSAIKASSSKNPQADRVILERMLNNVDESTSLYDVENPSKTLTKKDLLAKLFVFSIGKGLEKGDLNSRDVNLFLDNYYSLFNKTKSADDLNLLHRYAKQDQTIYKTDAEELEQAQSRIVDFIYKMRDDSPEAINMNIAKDLLYPHRRGQEENVETFTAMLLGTKPDETYPVLDIARMTEEQYVNLANKHSRGQYENFDDLPPELQDNFINIENTFKELLGVGETTASVNRLQFFTRYLEKSGFDKEKLDQFKKDFQVLTNEKILEIAFPLVGKGTIKKDTFWSKSTLANALDTMLKTHIGKGRREELIQLAMKNDPEAIKMLRSFDIDIDKLKEKRSFDFDRELDPLALHLFVTNKKDILKEIYGDDHYEVIEALIAPMGLVASTRRFPNQGIHSLQNDYTVPQAIGRAYSVMRGVLSPRYAITEFAVIHHRKAKFEVMKQVLSDPTFAQAFKFIFEAGSETAAGPRALPKWMGAAGSGRGIGSRQYVENLTARENDLLKYGLKKMIAINAMVQAKMENTAEDLQIPVSELYESVGRYTFGNYSEIFNSGNGQTAVNDENELLNVISKKHREDANKKRTIEKLTSPDKSDSSDFDIFEEMEKFKRSRQ